MYEFEFCFNEALVDLSFEPTTQHPLARINTQFLFHQRCQKTLLRGQVDFQNHVGSWVLPIRYKLHSGRLVDDVFECVVHATKLDIEIDYRDLSVEIDRAFPLWGYSLNSLTDRSAGKGSQGPHFPLLWLKRFESLQEDLAEGIRRSHRFVKMVVAQECRHLKSFQSEPKRVEGEEHMRFRAWFRLVAIVSFSRINVASIQGTDFIEFHLVSWRRP